MSYRTDEADIKQKLAAISDTDAQDWHLVFKARYGMQVAFEVLRRLKGPGAVLTQAFTCSTAVSPIVTAGLTPQYVDIQEATLMIDPRLIPDDATPHAVVLQHTFGIEAATTCRAVVDQVDTKHTLVLEDSAHALGLIVKSDRNEPLADVSFHSFGVEKMLGTRFGGAVWVNPNSSHNSVCQHIIRALESLPVVDRQTSLSSRAFVTQNRVLNRLPSRLGVPARELLVRNQLMEPPIADSERRGIHPYEPSKPSGWMLKKILAEFENLEDIQLKRIRASQAIFDEFAASGVAFPGECTNGEPYVRAPFFAPSPASAIRAVAAINSAGYFAGHWYRPLLFPGVVDEGLFGLTDTEPELPISRDLSARVVNLLTNVPESSAAGAARVAAAAIGNDQHLHDELGNADFVPVVLGTGLGAYAIARALHAEYGVRTLAIGRARLRETRDSEIVEVRAYSAFSEPEFILDTVLALSSEFAGRKILLIPTIELYTNVVMDNRSEFDSQYLIPLPERSVVDRLMTKADFYSTCEEIGVPYPKTMILTPDEASGDWAAPRFGYPLIVKAADTDLYQRVKFEGKKKIYRTSDEVELRDVVKAIFQSGYDANLVIQEYLSGDEAIMRIANTYSDQQGRTNFISVGQIVLTELNPSLVGNQNAIATLEDRSLSAMLSKLLEHVGYRGLANFDMMFDVNSGEYKVLEVNLRAGASHFYVESANGSLMRHLVQDLVYNDPLPSVETGDGGLWINVPYPVVLAFSPNSLRKVREKAQKQGIVHTLDYDKDQGIKRRRHRLVSDAQRAADTVKFHRQKLNE